MRRKRFFRRAVHEQPDRVFVAERDSAEFSDWLESLRNQMPVILELGIGTGDFLLQQALHVPDRFFLGIEIKPDRIYKAYQKSAEENLQNLGFLQTKVERLTDYGLPALEKIYMLFPDPWPKKKHAWRRMTSVPFLKMYQQLLSPDGSFVLKTDDRQLFEYSLDSFSEARWNILQESRDFQTEEAFRTAYERRFIAEKKPIYLLEATPLKS